MTDTPPQPAAPAEEEGHPHWQRNSYAMAAASFCLALGFGVSVPFMPLVLRDIGATGNLETWVGYAFGSYFGLSFFLTPLWGVVADHFGRKLMVLRTSMGMGLIYFLLPFAPNLTWFLVLFFLLGTTNGFIPATQALIATNTPRHALGRSLSLVQTGQLFGGAVGPAVGAALAPLLPDYRYLLFVSSGLLLTAGTIALVMARERHERPAGPFELHVFRDIAQVWRIPSLKLLYFIQFTYTFTYLGSNSIISVFTLEVLEDNGITGGAAVDYWVGAVALALTVSSAAAVPLWGRLIDRFGPRRMLVLGLAVGTLASWPVVVVQTPWQLVAARLLLGLMAVGVGPAGLALVRHNAPRGMEARVMAYGAAFGMLGIGGGPFIAGQIGPLLGLRAFFALNTVILLVALLLWMRHMRRHPSY